MNMLDRLSFKHRRVFEIEKNPDGTFDIREMCDQYFYETFTAEELQKLGEEIIELSKCSTFPTAHSDPLKAFDELVKGSFTQLHNEEDKG